MKIIEILEKNKIDYGLIKQKSYISLLNDNEFDINVIIGFRGREEFLNPIIKSFQKAIEYIKDKKICLTFIEHDIESKSRLKLEGKVNYLWTPGNVTEQYSRSFAYNFAVKYSNKAKHYILHDIDILVKKNFFEEIYENIKGSRCMQTYGKRRVLYLSQQLTPRVINKEVDFNLLDENSPNVSLPMYAGKPALGSKGGSIIIERDLFYEIGGFDPELFYGYASEDQIFFDKATTIVGEVTYADNPPIDMFHMWHPPTSMSNPLMYEMEEYMLQFRYMKKKDRLAFLELKKKLLQDE